MDVATTRSDAGEGVAPLYRAKPGSGHAPSRVGAGPGSACAAEGAPGSKGVARPRPSDEGDGGSGRSYPHRAKLGTGREPTRVGSCPDSACAVEGAPGCMGIAGPKPSDAVESAASQQYGRAGSPLELGPAQVQPERPRARQAARASPGRGRATRGRAHSLSLSGRSPDRAKPGSGREPTRVG